MIGLLTLALLASQPAQEFDSGWHAAPFPAQTWEVRQSPEPLGSVTVELAASWVQPYQYRLDHGYAALLGTAHARIDLPDGSEVAADEVTAYWVIGPGPSGGGNTVLGAPTVSVTLTDPALLSALEGGGAETLAIRSWQTFSVIPLPPAAAGTVKVDGAARVTARLVYE